MQTCNIYHGTCSGCGGSGSMPVGYIGNSEQCTMCGGTGKQLLGTVEIDVPTTAQFNEKFNQIADGLLAIWNKVKDL